MRLEVGLSLRRPAVWSTSTSLVTTSLVTTSLLILMAASSAANAACTPAAASGVTSTCTGVTNNYGNGTQTGVTVIVDPGATVQGPGTTAILVADGKVTNNVGATIVGDNGGVWAVTGAAEVINSGSIDGTATTAIFANTIATVTNHAGASITGATGIVAGTQATVVNAVGGSIAGGGVGIFATNGSVDLTNSGSVSGGSYGIRALNDVTATNNVGATITGAAYGIYAVFGAANVTNSGSIIATAPASLPLSTGISGANTTVTNNAGGVVAGEIFGIYGLYATFLTNSGTVSGGRSGVQGGDAATVINNAGASITGTLTGLNATTANVTNSGSITGVGQFGIRADTGATIVNNVGGAIDGALAAVSVTGAGAVTYVTNSGSIASSSGVAIQGTGATNVTNTAGGIISGLSYGVWGNGTFVSNSGSITGTSGIGINSISNLNVANNIGGSITGATVGIFASTGGSSVFNAGTLGGGTAAIQFAGAGNTLTLATTSVISGNVLGTGSDTLQLGGVGAASFDVSQIAAAGQYQGFGTLNKIESSVWTLTGTSTFAGPVNVNGGTLSVNGDLTSASSLTVNAGGTLGGNGTVGSTTINGGTLAPGNSIGLLTVSGSLVFTAASSYLVEVSPASADRTNVTGAATLGGATVNAMFAPGTYVAKRYTILNAGSISDTFAGPVNTNLPSGFRSSLSQDTTNVYLDLALAFTPPTGLNVNQQNVANALTNFFNSNGGIAAVYGSLTPAGLTQASGEIATGSQQTTFDAMNLFLGVLTDPFVAGRGPASGGAGASSFADDDDGIARAYAGRKPRTASERDAYAAIYRKAPLARVYEPRWSVWAAGFGGTQTTDGNGTLGSNTATSRIAEAAVGADYWFSPTTVAGFALAGGGTSFSVDNSGTGRSDLFQAGAFVRHNSGPAYVTAALAYGWQDITTDRTVTVAGADHLQARFNANTYSGRLEGGYRFVAPWTGGVGLTPYAAGQFTTFDLPAYAEQVLSGTNAFALSYASKTVTASRTELGLRADKSFVLNDAILTLRGRAAWAHDFNPDRSIAATFQALPGASFVVNGAARAHDAALTSAAAEVKFSGGLSLAAIFEGEFSNVTASYAGKGIVRYAW